MEKRSRKKTKEQVTPCVSILVPIYNVEDYLTECLNSIINQSLNEIEIICINDGSTDNSLQIIKDFAEKDDRIVIIDKPNTGYGDSMNCGLRQARGEYVGIVESDDFIMPEMYKILYKKAVNHNLDFIKGSCVKFWTDEFGKKKNISMFVSPNAALFDKVFEPKNNIITFDYPMHTWLGIYKRSFLLENNILHNTTPGASFQDLGFFFQTFALAKRAMFIKDRFYHYRLDRGGSSINDKNKIFTIVNEYKFIEEGFLKNHYLERLQTIEIIPLIKFRAYLRTLKRIDKSCQWDFIKNFRDEFIQYKKEGVLIRKWFNRHDWKSIKLLMRHAKLWHILNYSKLKYFYLFPNFCRTHTFKEVREKIKKVLTPKPWEFRDDFFTQLKIRLKWLFCFTGIPFITRKYLKFHSVKNSHKGEKCFIVCPGPSLTFEDIDKLKNIYTFGVNSIFLSYGQTDWRPNSYVLIDNYFYQKQRKSYFMPLVKFAKEHVFLNKHIKTSRDKKFIKFDLSFVNHTKKRLKLGKVNYSKNIAMNINDCFSVTNAAMEIAIYMGFKEIYLIGVDCNYQGKSLHFIPQQQDPVGERKNRMQLNIDRAITGYQALDRKAKKYNVKIYNATRGGNLEVFERKSLEEAIND